VTGFVRRPAAAEYGEDVAKAVGINHVALEVGDLDEALAFWQQIFGDLDLRGRGGGMAFIDLGDQFVALAQGRTQGPDDGRHFGLVVDDKEAVRERAREAGLPAGAPGGKLRIRDPWSNVIEVVDYRDVQFTKAPEIARHMGFDPGKSASALDELREKGLA
jgi:catechol 2,3-dioxygenase-like lactoylglutathione lyase family enzyme